MDCGEYSASNARGWQSPLREGAFLEIGLVQLENLILTRAQFLFLDLRTTVNSPLSLSIQEMLRTAIPLKAELVEAYLETAKIAKEFPVVLLCEHGWESRLCAQRLEASGHSNIYVVSGGTEALLSEG